MTAFFNYIDDLSDVRGITPDILILVDSLMNVVGCNAHFGHIKWFVDDERKNHVTLFKETPTKYQPFRYRLFLCSTLLK